MAGTHAVASGAMETSDDVPEPYGMLVDTTQCIGCRKCEWACAQANRLSTQPSEAFEDQSVFDTPRRMTAKAYTVVNRYANPSNENQPIYTKIQCMHCLRPACASACIVGALRRQPSGAVTYDAWKCLGCRYCMVACPFQAPAYEYDNPLNPVMSKCNFCFARVQQEGAVPACADICPPMALTFAKRSELVRQAHERVAAEPNRYFSRVYGEHEVGGTGWLYLTSRPPVELGFLELGDKPIPQLTETIQHSVFKAGLPPLLLYGLLGLAMKSFKTSSYASFPSSTWERGSRERDSRERDLREREPRDPEEPAAAGKRDDA